MQESGGSRYTLVRNSGLGIGVVLRCEGCGVLLQYEVGNTVAAAKEQAEWEHGDGSKCGGTEVAKEVGVFGRRDGHIDFNGTDGGGL